MTLKDFLEVSSHVPVEVRQWNDEKEEMTTLKDHKLQLILSKFGEYDIVSITAEVTIQERGFDNSIQVMPKLVVVII